MCYFNLKIPLQNEGRDSQVKRSECSAHFIPFFIAQVQRIFLLLLKHPKISFELLRDQQKLLVKIENKLHSTKCLGKFKFMLRL